MVASDVIGSDVDGAAVAASGVVADEGEQAESKYINASK